MKFFMVSKFGEGAGVLHDIESEGNEVLLHIVDENSRRVWDGLIAKADSSEPSEDSVVIFDHSGMGKLADELRSAGHFVVGGGEFADELEHDRMGGLKLMESVGIRIPYTAEFQDFSVKEVGEFVFENGDEAKRWVFKPSGKNLPCHLTYCAQDVADLLSWVGYVEKYYAKKVESFVLQEFLEGVCVSSEAWCDGTKFVRPFNHTLEVKGFMNGNLGQATGCSGNVVWAEHNDGCRIISEGIALVEAAVVRAGYVGPVDLNAVVNEDGVFGLEWTPRFGYSATPTLAKMIRRGELGKFFSDIARGQGQSVPMVDGFGGAVKLSIPPYPLEPDPNEEDRAQKLSPNIGIPIRNLPEDRSSLYFYEVEDEDGELVHSAGMGAIADVVGLGPSVEESFELPYDVLEEIVVPNKQYRTDLDVMLSEQYEEVEVLEGVTVGRQ